MGTVYARVMVEIDWDSVTWNSDTKAMGVDIRGGHDPAWDDLFTQYVVHNTEGLGSVAFSRINVVAGHVVIQDVTGNPESLKAVMHKAVAYATEARDQLDEQRAQEARDRQAAVERQREQDAEVARSIREA